MGKNYIFAAFIFFGCISFIAVSGCTRFRILAPDTVATPTITPVCTPHPTLPPAISGTGSISGTIRQTSCSATYPIPGAYITVYQAGTQVACTRTALNGTYTVSGLGTNAYDVKIFMGHDAGDYINSVFVNNGSITVNVDLTKTYMWTPGELLIQFDSSITYAQAVQIISNHCCALRFYDSDMDIYFVDVFVEDGQSTESMIPVFQAEPVNYVQADNIYCP